MEYPTYGSLIDYLRDVRKNDMHVTIAGHSNYSLTMELIGFGAQVARGMAYLASLKVTTTKFLIKFWALAHLGFLKVPVRTFALQNYFRIAKCGFSKVMLSL